MHIRKIVAVAAVTLCCAGFAAVPVMAGQPGETDGYAVNAAAGSAALTNENVPSSETEEEQKPEGEGQQTPGEDTEVGGGETGDQPEEQKPEIQLPDTLEISTLKEAYQLDVKVMDGEAEIADPDLVMEIVSGEDVIALDPEMRTVTASKEGTAGIRVSLAGTDIYADCEVTVGDLLNGVYQDPTDRTDCKFYYENGMLQNVTDVMRVNDVWYNIVNGRIVGNTIAQNKNGWWYIDSDGEVDLDYSGFAGVDSDWWYVVEGQVQRGMKDVIQGTVDGTDGWWYIEDGRVSFTDTVEQNRNGWWCIKAGMVDFDFQGFAENRNGWWYIEGGQVQLGTTDVIQGIVDDTEAWWYIEDGKVTYTETVAQNQNGWWYIRDGKVDFDYTGVEQNRKRLVAYR